jgi:hypothetical protein
MKRVRFRVPEATVGNHVVSATTALNPLTTARFFLSTALNLLGGKTLVK